MIVHGQLSGKVLKKFPRIHKSKSKNSVAMKKISIQFVVFGSLRVERSKNQINTYFCSQIEKK
ncbi:hypothetical protein BpHYR1_003201 [Brachionus plicatilis]|uniref:Uncharacterized protein n=1 Tax=Brachionus plicatilis TaxID=10195 RepID=A0A3M7PF47_BRAPC|nr:hypothetical protein BpHYR1_003201 [Brachionus plicatilis]